MNKINSVEIGCFSDIHIGLAQDNPLWHDEILKIGKWASNLYKQQNITEIVIPGDIFHNRSEISVKTLSIAKEFFSYFKDFKVYILVGNHDAYFKDRSDVNSVSLLDGWSNIVVVDKTPKIFETNFNKKISLVPWGVDVENIPQSDICFGHFEINSFYMNSYKVCDKGEDSQNLLSKSPFIISGHFHRKEIREYSNGQILYVGSPYQQNFGDAGDERGIYILNLKDNSYRFYKNNISPKHIKISIQKLIEKKIDANFLKENVSNNLISLNVDTIIDPQNISLLSNKIQKLSPKLFRIDYKEGSKSLITTQNFNIDSVNMLQNIEDFVLSLNIDHKPNLLEYLTNLYNKNLK